MTTTASSPAAVRPSASAGPPGPSPSADLLITPSLIESLLYPLHQLQQRQQTMPVLVVSSSSPNSSRSPSSLASPAPPPPPPPDFYPPMSTTTPTPGTFCLESANDAPKVDFDQTLSESAPVTTTSTPWWGEPRPNTQRDLSKLGLLHLDIGSTSTSPLSFSSASSSLSSSCPNSPSSLDECHESTSGTVCSPLASVATVTSTLSINKNKTSAWRKVRSLVTSPFMQTYKRQKYPWIQLAGHQGNFKSGQHPGTILKRLNGNEDECFRRLMLDALRSFAPVFYSVQTLGEGEMYLELEDLLAHFQNPSIMDVKMGTRTYLEEELIKAGEKPKLRKDMYDKMVAIDPDEPSGEERSLRAVTKPRYMVWRETISSTSTLGFRIDGIRVTEPPASDGNVPIKPIKDFKRTKTEESVCAAIRQFTANNAKCVTKYVERLRTIRKTIEHSEFFRTHEVIGSSLLFVHDNDHADIWLIDFAKTYPLPAGVSINHRDAWALGNHEDGYLTGLDNLIRIFSEAILVEQAPGPDSCR